MFIALVRPAILPYHFFFTLRTLASSSFRAFPVSRERTKTRTANDGKAEEKPRGKSLRPRLFGVLSRVLFFFFFALRFVVRPGLFPPRFPRLFPRSSGRQIDLDDLSPRDVLSRVPPSVLFSFVFHSCVLFSPPTMYLSRETTFREKKRRDDEKLRRRIVNGRSRRFASLVARGRATSRRTGFAFRTSRSEDVRHRATKLEIALGETPLKRKTPRNSTTARPKSAHNPMGRRRESSMTRGDVMQPGNSLAYCKREKKSCCEKFKVDLGRNRSLRRNIPICRRNETARESPISGERTESRCNTIIYEWRLFSRRDLRSNRSPL